MSLRPKLALVMAALSLAPAAARADKLDKEDKKWLDDVRPLILPDEEKTFRDLKDKSDRLEFEKVFWARRDPDLDTPENEFQATYNSARAEVDRQFKVGGTPGSLTDCGRVYLLLGKPDEMKQDKVSGDVPSLRPSEIWTYRDRPGQTFAGGQVQIQFEKDCQLPQGARLGEQLSRVAQDRVVHPNLAYTKTPDGHLVKLADQLPKPTPAQALLKTPRQDFAAAAQNSMMLRSPGGEGATYVAGLVRATGVPRDAGAKTVPVNVAVQAIDAKGKVAAQKERQVTAEFAEDGSVLISYGMPLRPGSYKLNVAVFDPKSGKGSVATQPVEVADVNEAQLEVMPLVLLQNIQEGGATADPKDPLADFVLGQNRLVPVFDNVFPKGGALNVIGAYYNATKDAGTGKASVNWSYSILKDGKLAGKMDDQMFETDAGTPVIGPVPLAGYSPGKYTVQLKLKDNVAKKDYTKEASFEVK